MFNFKNVSENTEIDVDYTGSVVIRQGKPSIPTQSVVISIYDVPTVIFALQNLLWEGRDRAHYFEQECTQQSEQHERSRARQQCAVFDDDDPLY